MKLREAIETDREALKELTRDRAPIDWARIHVNLGNALTSLGEREGETPPLNEAVAAYGEALKELTRERAFLEWAEIQGNQGFALLIIASRRGDIAKAESALAQINRTLELLRDGGYASDADHFERQLASARVIVEGLRVKSKRRATTPTGMRP